MTVIYSGEGRKKDPLEVRILILVVVAGFVRWMIFVTEALEEEWAS